MVLQRSYKMWNLMLEQFPEEKLPFPSSPESLDSDYNEFPTPWPEDDLLQTAMYKDVELDKNPELFTLVSPVSFKPVPLHSVPLSPEPEIDHGLLTSTKDANIDEIIPWEFLLPNCLDDFSDEFINDIAKVDINSTVFDDPLENSSNSGYCDDQDSSSKIDFEEEEVPVYGVQSGPTNKPSHLDFDHCYSAPPKVEKKKKNYWNVVPYSPFTSETSSEVDVVTVSEEPVGSPVVPKKVVTVQKAPPKKRGRKCVNKKKEPAPAPPAARAPLAARAPPTARALKAAVRNSRITTVRRARVNKSKKASSEVPSPSTSSLNSSRCNSDSEETCKRASHNISERRRREILKNSLQTVRKSVPATTHNLKAAKVTILNAAAKYVYELRDKEINLMRLKSIEEEKFEQRNAHLQMLLAQVKEQIC